MADKNEYYHPTCRPPGDAPFDPVQKDPIMKEGCRWWIRWKDYDPKELPKFHQKSDMGGTRVLRAGSEKDGNKLEVMTYKDFFKHLSDEPVGKPKPKDPP